MSRAVTNKNLIERISDRRSVDNIKADEIIIKAFPAGRQEGAKRCQPLTIDFIATVGKEGHTQLNDNAALFRSNSGMATMAIILNGVGLDN